MAISPLLSLGSIDLCKICSIKETVNVAFKCARGGVRGGGVTLFILFLGRGENNRILGSNKGGDLLC